MLAGGACVGGTPLVAVSKPPRLPTPASAPLLPLMALPICPLLLLLLQGGP